MNIYTGAESNNRKSQELLGMVVWTGVVKVYNNGAYVLAKYSHHTALTKGEALKDAEALKGELAESGFFSRLENSLSV